MPLLLSPYRVGSAAGFNSTSNLATLIGYQAGSQTGNATTITAVGANALTWPQGNFNVAVGSQSMLGNNVTFSAAQNTAVGTNTLQTITTGNDNVALGYNAAASITINNRGVYVGSGSGSTLSDDCVALGYNTIANTNGIAIGSNATTNGVVDAIAIGKNASVAAAAQALAITINAACYTPGVSIGCTVNGNVEVIALASGAVSLDPADPVYHGTGTFVANSGAGSVTIGGGASTTGSANGTVIGSGSSATAAGATALGTGITANQIDGFFVRHRGPAVFAVNAAGFINTGTNELVEITSSRRYKQNIRPLESVSDRVKKMNPVRYEAKPGHGDERTHIGLIAEEIEELFPEFVIYDSEGLVSGMMFDRLTAVLIKELQEMRTSFEDRLSALEMVSSADGSWPTAL